MTQKFVFQPVRTVKVAIFYLSFKRGQDRQRIVVDGQTWGYVRVQIVDAVDEVDGLDAAVPEPDETVMNAHQVPG